MCEWVCVDCDHKCKMEEIFVSTINKFYEFISKMSNQQQKKMLRLITGQKCCLRSCQMLNSSKSLSLSDKQAGSIYLYIYVFKRVHR